MSVPASGRVLRVFYRDYERGVTIGSTHPEALAVERIEPLARRLLVAGENFLGVVDRNDVILQCYPGDAPDDIVFELVYPEATGCLRLVVLREEAFARLNALPGQFDESLLQGAQYFD